MAAFLLRVMNCSSLRAAQYLVVYVAGKSSRLLIDEVHYAKIRRVWNTLPARAGHSVVVWPKA